MWPRRPTLEPMIRVLAVMSLVLIGVGCSDGGDDEPGQITRIDGPAVVDEDRDGQLDG